MKKVLIFLLMATLVQMAAANPYPSGSQAWHDWNAIANSEAERMNRERAAYQRNAPVREVKDRRETWGVFVYNLETGDYNYDISKNFELSYKNLMKQAKQEMKRHAGVDSDREFHWKNVYATIVMGKNTKTGKWEAMFDTDMKKWKKFINQGYDETNLLQAVENELVEKCRAKKLDRCQVVVNLKKILELSYAK